MDPQVEKILLAQASREAEQGPRLGDMISGGAGIGAALGVMTGGVGHVLSRLGKAPVQGLGRLKPGLRMAGGLVGAIGGGALGAFAQQQMVNEPSGAGRLLAKMQAQGGLTGTEKEQLEAVLADAYTRDGLLG